MQGFDTSAGCGKIEKENREYARRSKCQGLVQKKNWYFLRGIVLFRIGEPKSITLKKR